MLPTLLSGSVVATLLGHPMVVLLLKATIILLAAFGATVAMQRRSAGARHLVWLVALATLIVVPALAIWSPIRVAVLPPETALGGQLSALGARPSAIGAQPTTPAVDAAERPEPSAERRQPTAEGVQPSGESAQPTAGHRPLSPVTLALAIWGFVVLAIASSLAWSALVVRRIVRRAEPLSGAGWTTPLFEVADRLELDEVPRLLRSEQAKMPFACGLLTPTIVLPAECDAWSLDRRRAVLLHELAHVRRHDLVGHTLGRLACALWWFHPLVWSAAKQLRAESERACDDLALSCGTRATDYAEHLLDIVTSVRRDATPSVALAMARRKEFEGRMLAILDPEAQRATPGRLQTAGLVASLGLIALVVGAAAPAPRRAAAQEIAGRDSTRAERHERQRIDRAIDKSINKSIDKSVNASVDRSVKESVDRTQTETRTETQTRTEVRDATGRIIGRAVAGAVAGAAASAAASAGRSLTPESLRDYIEEGQDHQGKSSRAHDDRPALLANVLKTDANPELRRVAAWGLSEYGDEQVAVDALAFALKNDKDADVREMAAWALGEGGGERGMGTEALADAVRSDASEKVRETAVWALGERGDRSAIPALVVALGSKNVEIRRKAVWAMGEIGPRSAPPELIAMLRDPDSDVRATTAWALHEIEDPASVPALQAALNAEKDESMQELYIRALGAIGEKSVDAIRGMLTSSNPRIKEMAVRALAGGDATGPWPMPMPMPRPYPN